MRKLTTQEAKNQFERVWGSFRTLSRRSAPVWDPTKSTYTKNIGLIWDAYFGKDMSEKVYQGCLNMALAHYAETKLDDIPEGSVGYFLGRRKCFVKHINHVFKSRKLKWEKDDPSKADFFMVGDILTSAENDLNEGLQKPIVMDITIENEWHHNHSGTEYITNVNEGVITSLARRGERKDMDNLSLILQYVHPDALSNASRTRIVLQYLKCVGSGYSYQDKEHKKLIRMMRRITLPQHQFLLEPKFSNSYNNVIYNIADNTASTNNGLEVFGYLGCTTSYSSHIYLIPMEEDTLDLMFEDKKEKVFLERNLEKHRGINISSRTRYNYGFRGKEVTASISFSYLETLIEVNLDYFSPDSKKDPCRLLRCNGRIPVRGSYGVTYTSFSYSSEFANSILELVKPFIEDEKYKHYNLPNDSWTYDHFEPIKDFLLDNLKTFCKKNYGERSLKLLD